MAKSLANLRRRIAAQADYHCGYCLTSERLTGIRLTLDHIIPLAAGGQSEENNLWVACRPCNEFKGAQTRAKILSRNCPPLFLILDFKIGMSTSNGASME